MIPKLMDLILWFAAERYGRVLGLIESCSRIDVNLFLDDVLV
jgi:hypothetical protein